MGADKNAVESIFQTRTEKVLETVHSISTALEALESSRNILLENNKELLKNLTELAKNMPDELKSRSRIGLAFEGIQRCADIECECLGTESLKAATLTAELESCKSNISVNILGIKEERIGIENKKLDAISPNQNKISFLSRWSTIREWLKVETNRKKNRQEKRKGQKPAPICTLPKQPHYLHLLLYNTIDGHFPSLIDL